MEEQMQKEPYVVVADVMEPEMTPKQRRKAEKRALKGAKKQKKADLKKAKKEAEKQKKNPPKPKKERYGDFDPEEAFLKALERSYGENFHGEGD